MRRNTERKHYKDPRIIYDEVHYPYQCYGNFFNAKSERCLFTGLREKLHSSSPGNRRFRTMLGYFHDILYTANGLDHEFRKMENLFFPQRQNSCHYNSVKPPTYTLNDMVYLHFSTKSLLKVISNLKEDLMFEDHCTSLEEHQSLIQTKLLINNLEIRIFTLLKEIEHCKIMPDECISVGCRNQFAHGTSKTGSNVDESQFKKRTLNIPVNQGIEKVFGGCNCLLSQNYRNLHCSSAPSCFQEHCNNRKQLKNRCHDNVYHNVCCKNTKHLQGLGDMKRSKYRYRSLDDSVANKTQCSRYSNKKNHENLIKDTNKEECFGSKQVNTEIRRSTKSLNKNRSNFINSSLRAARKDQYCKDTKKSRRMTLKQNIDSLSDTEQIKRNFNRNPRKRTRAGKDPGRNRSHPDNSAFRINKSPTRYRSYKRKDSKKKRRSYDRGPSRYSNESIIYESRSRNRGKGKRKAVKRMILRKPKSEITRSSETKMRRRFRSTSRATLPVPDDLCSECYNSPLEYDNNSCSPTTFMRNIYEKTPQICCPENNCNYQYIPYPLCSNVCDSSLPRTEEVVSPVQSERFSIEFERPRKKKIVRSRTNSFKVVYYKPPTSKTKRKYVKFRKLRKKSSERVIEDETPASSEIIMPTTKRSPIMTLSQGTSTERLSSVSRQTSTSELIKAVKAIGTNTKYSTREKGTNPIPQMKTPSPKTKTRYTNTEVIERRTTGTHTTPIPDKPKARMVNKATDPSYVIRKDKETNTISEQKRRVVNVGTDPLPKSLTSKATNTIIMKERDIPQPITISVGTQPTTILTKSVRTSYDKVDTREKGTNPVEKIIDKGQQFHYIEPHKSVATISEEVVGYKQVYERQRSEHLHTLTSQPKNQMQTLINPPVKHALILNKQQVHHAQGLSKQPIIYTQVIKKQPVEHLLVSEKQQVEQGHNYTEEPLDHTELIAKKPVGYGQILTKIPRNQEQLVTHEPGKPKQLLVTKPAEHGKILTKISDNQEQLLTMEHGKPKQLLVTKPVEHGQILSKISDNQEQLLTKDPGNPKQVLLKQTVGYRELLTEELPEYMQCPLKPPVKHLQTLTQNTDRYVCPQRKQSIHYRRTFEIQKPGFTYKYEQESPKNVQTTSIVKPKQGGYTITQTRVDLKQPADSIRIEQLPQVPYDQGVTLNQSSSDISMHLTIEKLHEEVFRRRCKFCLCVKKCECKCCSDKYNHKEKLIVCEKKKSNIIRITNRPDCEAYLEEGEEMISDVDVEVNFNITSSSSTICFTNNKVQVGEIKETQPGFCNMNCQNYYPIKNKCDCAHCLDSYYMSDCCLNNHPHEVKYEEGCKATGKCYRKDVEYRGVYFPQ